MRSTLSIKLDTKKMKYEERLDKVQDKADDAAKAVQEVAKHINEAAKEQYDKMAQCPWMDEHFGEERGNLITGILAGVVAILFVYGICKFVDYLENEKK